MRRVFVALSLPQNVLDDLGRIQTGLPKIRWIRPENLHLTLAFIGEVDEPALEDIHSALSTLRLPRFELTLQGTGQFGNGKPRAVWAGIGPSAPLTTLQEKVETALHQAGLTLTARKFTPHVTLARIRSLPPERVGRYMERFGLFATGPFTVAEFQLIESVLKPGGAVYLPLADYPLLASSG